MVHSGMREGQPCGGGERRQGVEKCHKGGLVKGPCSTLNAELQRLNIYKVPKDDGLGELGHEHVIILLRLGNMS